MSPAAPRAAASAIAASLRTERASNSLMSPSRSRASAIARSRPQSSADSPGEAGSRIGRGGLEVGGACLGHHAKPVCTSGGRPRHRRRTSPPSRVAGAARSHQSANVRVPSNCLGPHGKSSDSTGLRSWPRFDQIRFGEAEVGERDLKLWVVPQSDRHCIVWSQSVVDRDARRHRLGALDPNAVVDALPKRGVEGREVRWMRSMRTRRTQSPGSRAGGPAAACPTISA